METPGTASNAKREEVSETRRLLTSVESNAGSTITNPIARTFDRGVWVQEVDMPSEVFVQTTQGLYYLNVIKREINYFAQGVVELLLCSRFTCACYRAWFGDTGKMIPAANALIYSG